MSSSFNPMEEEAESSIVIPSKEDVNALSRLDVFCDDGQFDAF